MRRAAPLAVGATALLAALPARASLADDTGLTGTADSAGVAGSGDIAQVVGGLIGGFIGLLGIVLVVIVIYAGFLWMTAQGNDEKVKQAKKMISNAVVGLVIVFASYAIVEFVLTAIAESADPVFDQGQIMTCAEEVAAGLRSPPCP